ncbi:MAG TPA: type II secretion system F family protein [bacterium]|nr:type II secretion system F family protein [bacterium]
MQFFYKAKTEQGKIVKGTLEAQTRSGAVSLLKDEGLFVTLVKEQKGGLLSFSFGTSKQSIPLKEKILFTKHFGLMVRSGLSVVETLTALAEETPNKAMSAVIKSLLEDISGGKSISEAFEKRSNIFGEIYINMLKSGEQSGKLDVILERLAIQLEKEYGLARKIKGALSYPLFVLVTMVAVTAIIIVFVIPQLKIVFDDAGVKLPLLTRIMLGTSDLLRQYGRYLLVVLVISVIIIMRWKQSKSGHRVIDHLIIYIPVIGTLVKKSYLARFTRTFSSLLASGLPMLSVFKFSAKVIGNVYYEEECNQIAKHVETGEKISVLFKRSKYFPKMIGQMAAVGEKSGQMDAVFGSMADFYDKEVDDITGNLSTLLEPIMMVIMAIGVGLVIVSVLQPIYGLVDTI